MRPMDDLHRLEAKGLARAKARSQRRRTAIIRRRTIRGSLALFAVFWAIIFGQLATGNDPALSHTGGGSEKATATNEGRGSASPGPGASVPAAAPPEPESEAEAERELEAEREAEWDWGPETESEWEPEAEWEPEPVVPIITSAS